MNNAIEKHRGLILAVIGLLIVGGIAAFLIRWQPAAAIAIEPPPPTATLAPTTTPSPIQVYVSGAVLHPDVYTLSPDTIARDAIDAAGGANPDADLTRVNLAQALYDGMQIHVPCEGEVPLIDASESADGPVIPAGPVNINTADQATLETLPGIGPAYAQRIIDYRDTNGPFETLEEIQNVSGIGPATFEQLRDLITIGD